MAMRYLIKGDLYRYGGLQGWKGFIRGMFIPGFCYMLYWRFAHNYRMLHPIGFFFHWKIRRLSYKYGFQIPAQTKIGKGFYIGHHGTVIINPLCTIGDNCNISPGVTIGQTNRGAKQGVPTIGNQVWIGTNSIIVGAITIEDNVLIAPNTYVNMDIPSNSIVIGNPAKIISKENPTDKYICYTV